MIAMLEPLTPASAPVTDDPLVCLQLRVACRADEIVHEFRSTPRADLLAWLQAEREIFAAGRDGTGGLVAI